MVKCFISIGCCPNGSDLVHKKSLEAGDEAGLPFEQHNNYSSHEVKRTMYKI